MLPEQRLAAWLAAYPLDFKNALNAARHDAFRSVHADTLRADFQPQDFSHSARRHVLRYLRDLGMTLDAITAAFPGRGLADAALTEQRLAHLRATVELCTDLGVGSSLVTVSGFADPATAGLAHEVLAATADLADRAGVQLAIQSADAPETVAEQIARVGCPNLALAVDTAHTGRPAALSASGGRIGAVHLRDVRHTGDRVEEVPFGTGEVDFARVLADLGEAAYSGAFVVRRDAANAPVDAMRQAREYVVSLLNEHRSQA